jgi:glutathione S-transferase
MNPVGMVPVLDDRGVVVWESNVIVRYLASSRGRGDLLPAEPAQRAQVEQWMDWQASDFNNSWRVAFQALVRRNPEFQDELAIEKSAQQLSAAIGVLDGVLARTRAYIAGENFTAADIVIGLSVHRWKSIPYAWAEFSSVARYYERLLEREGFRRFGRDAGP